MKHFLKTLMIISSSSLLLDINLIHANTNTNQSGKAISVNLPITSPDNKIHFETEEDWPGHNFAEENRLYANIKPIVFAPADGVISNGQGDTPLIGYFWDIHDPDNSYMYPGKARIGNDQYVEVTAVDSTKVDTRDDVDRTISTASTNLLADVPSSDVFDPGFLTHIGTFMKKNDPTIYYLYGRYLSTVFPDPAQSNVEFV